jgi:hypothetical protein
MTLVGKTNNKEKGDYEDLANWTTNVTEKNKEAQKGLNTRIT